MSYAINITGHRVTESEEESRKLEQEVLEKVDELVANLPGVDNAVVSGSVIGFTTLVGDGPDAAPPG